MAKRTLTNADFCRASKRLKCEVAAIKAVAFVESRGNGFYSDGFPVILFERHIFRKYTQGRYNKSHPHLSGPAGNYGAAGQNQRNKFNEAFALNPDAAMKACSWGKFQIMGFNHAVCGFATVGEFVDAMKEDEGKHLDAFVGFVISNNLARYLRALAWASFAKGYNGAGYAKNKYDTKMASAYTKFSRENIDCNSTAEPADKPVSDPHTSNLSEQTGTNDAGVNLQEPPSITETVTTVEQNTVETPEGTGTQTILQKAETVGDKFQAFQSTLDKFGFSIEDAKRSIWTVVMTFGKLIFAGIMTAWSVVTEHWEYLLFAALLIVIAYLLWDRSGKRVAEAKAGVPVDVAKEMIKKM